MNQSKEFKKNKTYYIGKMARNRKAKDSAGADVLIPTFQKQYGYNEYPGEILIDVKKVKDFKEYLFNNPDNLQKNVKYHCFVVNDNGVPEYLDEGTVTADIAQPLSDELPVVTEPPKPESVDKTDKMLELMQANFNTQMETIKTSLQQIIDAKEQEIQQLKAERDNHPVDESDGKFEVMYKELVEDYKELQNRFQLESKAHYDDISVKNQEIGKLQSELAKIQSDYAGYRERMDFQDKMETKLADELSDARAELGKTGGMSGLANAIAPIMENPAGQMAAIGLMNGLTQMVQGFVGKKFGIALPSNPLPGPQPTNGTGFSGTPTGNDIDYDAILGQDNGENVENSGDKM